jgi:hypothetical protein
MILNLGCIVEGHGEVKAVPLLLRRLGQQCDPSLYLNIPQPFRAGRYKLVKPGELERAVEIVARRLETRRAILILIDAEDDCPKELAPQLCARAERTRSDVPVGVVLAKREFEAWFLAAIESLGGRRGLADALAPVEDPEAIRDVKRLLTRNMQGSRAYSETVDQPALAALFDLQLARERSDSFDKCWREVSRLFGEAAGQATETG